MSPSWKCRKWTTLTPISPEVERDTGATLITDHDRSPAARAPGDHDTGNIKSRGNQKSAGNTKNQADVLDDTGVSLILTVTVVPKVPTRTIRHNYHQYPMAGKLEIMSSTTLLKKSDVTNLSSLQT